MKIYMKSMIPMWQPIWISVSNNAEQNYIHLMMQMNMNNTK